MSRRINQIQVKRACNYTDIGDNRGFLFGEPIYVCDENTLYIGNGCDNTFQNLKHVAEDLCVCDGDSQIFRISGANTHKVGSVQFGKYGCGFCAGAEGLYSADGNVMLTYTSEFGGLTLTDQAGSLDIGTTGISFSSDGNTSFRTDSFSDVAQAIFNGASFIHDEQAVNSDSSTTTTIGCSGIETKCDNATVQSAKWSKIRSIYYGDCEPDQYFQGSGITPNEGDIYICL